ncbi:hypothetical protein OO013_16295 [Mangrovivirga sp. M17]|uniref:WD40 repeat protein n=1 Tax=Mangrovivirga halotolerans TaxID=2993936 RepID=A0ABT3RUV8_9BACT|nr:hypothetical protein [Mangrovivirga halotolerans]MCX2745441.1 hypothetical protein [Mangrovivirga halotolerans]
MKRLPIFIILVTVFMSCSENEKSGKMKYLVDEIPTNIPIEFKNDIVPENKLIHKGIFSPDLEEYYYTISDPSFEKFDIYVIKKEDDKWSNPRKAFFNSNYSEHGMCFSPEGNTLYFSSTRPVEVSEVSQTWHIWKSEKVEGKWSEPTYVDIPNLRDKLVSHPTLSNSGTLYFHSGNLDYSEMDIYRSRKINNEFKAAERVPIDMNTEAAKCTPFISPQEDYMIFASIGDQLDLMISFNDGNGHWINTRKLNNKINDFGQGNPYVTPDNKFLFFTTGRPEDKAWKIKWVNIQSELKIN